MHKTDLKSLQGFTLEDKVDETLFRIHQWYHHYEGNVYVSFSGGRDSTVLLDLVWSIFPDVPAVFSNTGLELKDTKNFVELVRKHGVTSIVDGQRVYRKGQVLRVIPKKPYNRVIKEDGYALVSKKVAKTLRILKEEKDNPNWANTYRLYNTGIKRDGTFSKASKIPEKWRPLVASSIKVSEACCDHLKKEPLDTYAKETGRKPIMGIMADEGGLRASSSAPCNAFDIAKPRSAPMLFWKQEDVTEYIKSRKLRISRAYLWVRNDEQELCEPEQRTGCAFCMFGAHLEPKNNNRFTRLYKRDRRMWDTAVNKLGLSRPLQLIDVKYLPDATEKEQLELFKDAG
jgi:3'-phosphoadenosine 5'-phosphosulfate sulfotransferase (PAPS reductase)/FAD synthetase